MVNTVDEPEIEKAHRLRERKRVERKKKLTVEILLLYILFSVHLLRRRCCACTLHITIIRVYTYYNIHNNVIVKTVVIRLNVRSVGENSSRRRRRRSAFHEETTTGGRRARVVCPGVNEAAQAHHRVIYSMRHTHAHRSVGNAAITKVNTIHYYTLLH